MLPNDDITEITSQNLIYTNNINDDELSLVSIWNGSISSTNHRNLVLVDSHYDKYYLRGDHKKRNDKIKQSFREDKISDFLCQRELKSMSVIDRNLVESVLSPILSPRSKFEKLFEKERLEPLRTDLNAKKEFIYEVKVKNKMKKGKKIDLQKKFEKIKEDRYDLDTRRHFRKISILAEKRRTEVIQRHTQIIDNEQLLALQKVKDLEARLESTTEEDKEICTPQVYSIVKAISPMILFY